MMNSLSNPPPPPILSRIKPKLKPHSSIAFSACHNQIPPVTTEIGEPGIYSVEFNTLGDCKLGISTYPDFVYDAQGGQGTGTGTATATKGISVSFDVRTLYIPPLTSATTRFLGLPLPPFLRIDISPELFRGTIDDETGKVELEFKAKFWFSVANVYKAPPLIVDTILTSEESKGRMRKGRGKRLDRDGKCKLVGVATVDPVHDIFIDTFLGLPTECLADLNASIALSASYF